MQLSWKRGFLRVWAVLAIIWITFFGWREYSLESRWTDIHVGGECWDHLAKWPDGTRLDDWDVYFNDAPAGSGNERDQWRESIRQKLKVCELAKPLMQRSTAWLDDNFTALKGSLVLIFLPPFSLLLFGLCIGWVVRGFKPKPT